MNAKLLGLLALVYLGVPAAVSASPITYDLIEAAAGGEPLYGDLTLTGNFTFDPTGPTLEAANITVTGTIFAGLYNFTYGAYSNLIIFQSAAGNVGGIDFASNLSLTDDSLTAVSFSIPSLSLYNIPFLATGYASPTPLPAALPLFATGLGALGLFGWRRTRKAAALAA
jgi:hypothetical protein